MDFSSYFPIWKALTPKQQQLLEQNAIYRKAEKGTIIHNGNVHCTGLLLVRRGQLRAYILSEEGKEITLYRLLDRDLCLFSATCIMNSLQFEIAIEAEKETEFWVIHPDIYKALMTESAPVAGYTNEVMATRFSDVLWLLEQILWNRLDKRLALFLLNEAELENTKTLRITHEGIGKHIGSQREVVTRMLQYFKNEGIVTLSRNTIELHDFKKLKELSK